MRRKPVRYSQPIFSTFPIFRYKYEELSSSVAYIQLNITSISGKKYNFAANVLLIF